ncbi:EamA family transporter [Streptomyces afghaniensis]|uniref:EamA family transporter n=1 Tax=Streptomyces afghaniensis TaxID=66865 RepID=UPI002468E993|nr:EamA family transporter [Streptomyces afghaniensis]
MGALLALSSAVVYGIVDFAGGLLSRHIHHAAVTFLGQLGGLLLACAAALLIPADTVHTADLLWGALSGVGSGVAMRFLNRGLSSGAMSVVVPVSAVTGVALSVLCGVLVLGDRPGALAWLGIGVTVPALWFVSGGRRGSGKGTADGLLASAGVAVQYLALGQAATASGLWPVAAGRAAAVLVLLPDAARHARRLRLPPGRCVQALLIGAGRPSASCCICSPRSASCSPSPSSSRPSTRPCPSSSASPSCTNGSAAARRWGCWERGWRQCCSRWGEAEPHRCRRAHASPSSCGRAWNRKPTPTPSRSAAS